MNNINLYLLFNPELKKLNKILLKKEYINDLKTNNRITSIEIFFKKYPNFNIKKYVELNPSLKNLPNLNILLNYHLEKDKKEKNLEEILEENSKEKKIIQNNYKPKLAHIFVHLFEIGGGESYLSNFNKYNTIFNETLFLNNNYPNKTLFKFNGKIIYYKSYSELNKYLINYDIIVDHQLYWFDFEISLESFKNLFLNKIIRITHGVPIHEKDINKLNYFYSIELYKDINSHQSWNNHIKIYNNIGVSVHNFKIIKNLNRINVAIIGRIDIHKVPVSFLKELILFSIKNNRYIFNFYGLLDKKYEDFFKNEIKKSNYIIFHNIIHPSKMINIYNNNDILISPSLSEAGSTVILEAMSNGLPIICRNTGGNPNAIGNNNFLCNNDKDFFINLLKIDDMNYSNISNENILKIKKENDEDIQFNNLINIINTIHSYENQNDIPNIIHYVYGLEKLNTEFPFVYYISILSNLLINKPIVIYFHYQYEPFGIWWEKIKKSVKLNYINADNIYWGNKKILNYAHKSDKIRLEMLYKYGGIYMDIDTISFKSYSNYLSYDFVIGIQSENYGKDNITLYCNAILLSKKNNIFIKNWIEKYEYYFDNNDWCKASVHLPHKIFDIISLNDKKNIKVLEKECFYYPSYNETNKIFENDNETNEEINEKLITLHLWNTYSHKYFKDINNFDWNNGSLYSKLLYNIRNLFYTT